MNLCANGLQHFGARPIGIFIGVELDEVSQLGLLTRFIRCQLVDNLAPVLAQASLSGDIQPNARVPAALRRVPAWMPHDLMSAPLEAKP